MAQIIKHRRGSLESLANVTASLQKGEIVIASGSSNLSVSNGSSIVFAAAENGVLQPINRILTGTGAPNNFAASTYNGLLNGVPYYDSTSGSLYILGSDTNTKLNLLGNINEFSQSVDSRLDSVETSIGGGGTGIGARVANLEAVSASLEAFTGSQETKNNTLGTYTGSIDTKFGTLATYTASVDNRLNNLELDSASQDSRLDNLESFSGSQETKNNTLATYTGSIDTKWSTIENVTASLQSFTSSQETKNQTLATLTQSIATEQSAQNTRLTTIESFTGSYATTGSNVFFGNQVITGSVYIAYNLVVQGSSSLQDITASAVDIGTNRIRLNTDSPAVRFAGLEVYDSGSQQTTGSLYWDSLYNHWISVRPSSSTEAANSAMLIYGPKNTGALGNETGLTAGYIPVAEGEDHIANSIMSQAAGKITLSGSLDVLNEISASTINGIGNVSAFSQSLDSRLDVIESSLGGGGSIGTRVAALEAFSGSQETKNNTLATYTGSIDTKWNTIENVTASLQSFSSSQETKNSTLSNWSSSVDTMWSTLQNVTASILNFTSSQETKNNTLSTYTSSVDNKLNNLELTSASVNVSVSNLNSYTQSQDSKNSTLATYTASVDGRLSNIESFSGSQETKNNTLATYTASVDSKLSNLINITGSYATTGSNTFIGTQTISGSINVSGSTNFNGAVAVNDSNMNLTNSSSLNLTSGSSIYVNGDGVISGSIVGIGNVTAYSQSVDSRLDTIEASLGGGGSIGTRVAALEVTSASLLLSASNHEDRIDSIESYTSSLKAAISVSGLNLTVNGNLNVLGTQTVVDSTTIQLGDNIIELNGTGAANGGIYVKDPTAPNTATGSLIWDSTNDYWKAGTIGAESKVLLAGGDSVVSGSSQITISSTTGFTSFSSSIATDFTNTNLSSSTAVTNLSSSVSASQYVQDLRLGVLEGTGTIQGVGTNNTVSFTAVSASLNVPTVASGNASSKRVAFRNAIGTIDFAPSASVAGDLLQWDGTDFVMSNVIDGGSF